MWKEGRLKPSHAHNYLQESGKISVNSRYDARDKAWVRWHEVERIVEPEFYMITGGDSPFVWYGVLIVDRKRRRGYIAVQGD